MATHKHKVGKERPPIWAAVISGLPTFNMPSMCTSTHMLTHMLIHTHTHTHTHSYSVPQKHSRKSHTFRVITVQMLNSFLDPVRVKFLWKIEKLVYCVIQQCHP